MDVDFLKLAATQGVWASLAIVLIFYILRFQERMDEKHAEREKQYQKLINKLAEQLCVVNNPSEYIEKIKKDIKT